MGGRSSGLGLRGLIGMDRKEHHRQGFVYCIRKIRWVQILDPEINK